VQPLGGPGKAQLFGHGHEIAELAEIEHSRKPNKSVAKYILVRDL
jgi:hypothetical protein